MNRVRGLRDLSSDHHTGLVLVRHIRHTVAHSPDDVESLWDVLVERFGAELEPHFQEEEQGLLPALAARGEGALVERTLQMQIGWMAQQQMQQQMEAQLSQLSQD